MLLTARENQLGMEKPEGKLYDSCPGHYKIL